MAEEFLLNWQRVLDETAIVRVQSSGPFISVANELCAPES